MPELRRAVVIEDDPDIRGLLVRILVKQGFEVTQAEAGSPCDDAESGRGLALIEALVTTVTFERQDGTNTWILTRTSQP